MTVSTRYSAVTVLASCSLAQSVGTNWPSFTVLTEMNSGDSPEWSVGSIGSGRSA